MFDHKVLLVTGYDGVPVDTLYDGHNKILLALNKMWLNRCFVFLVFAEKKKTTYVL